MRRTAPVFVILFFLLVPPLAGRAPCASAAEDHPSIRALNSTNLAARMSGLLGYLYDSHGCVHLTPSDALLLTRTLRPGTSLRIRNYAPRWNRPALPDVPELAALVMDEGDLEEQRRLFASRPTKLVVYPSSKSIIIYVGGSPYARVKALAGPPQVFRMPLVVRVGEPIVWDPFPATPTDAGYFRVLRATDHYVSPTYRDSTVLPFGAWIMKSNGSWHYQENGGGWRPLPAHIVKDIEAPRGERKYSYFDVNRDGGGRVWAARWGSNDFGRHVLLWTRDGRSRSAEMAYSCGEILLEQTSLVKSLAYLLTADGPDDLDSLASGSANLSFYREVHKFLKTGIEPASGKLSPSSCAYFRLFNKWPLSNGDRALMDGRLVKALAQYRGGKLPWRKRDREEAIGLYNYLRINSEIIKKYAGWYSKLKDDWQFWADMRSAIREDMRRMGVRSQRDRGILVEKWLTDRLEFRSVALPGGDGPSGSASLGVGLQ